MAYPGGNGPCLRGHFRLVKFLDLMRKNIGGLFFPCTFFLLICYIIIMKLNIPRTKLILDLLSIFLGELMAFLVELVSLAHLVLNGWVIILPVEAKMALHVVQSCIGRGLRKPTYILRRCRLVPFLSRNISMLYCSLLYIMNQNAHARRVMTTNSHYEVLGVARNASSKDIKKAYREMALIYHPDKNSNPEAKEVFNKLVNSYNVLSNEDQRRTHDDQLARPKQAQQHQPPRQQQFQKKNQKSAQYFKSHYYDHQHSDEKQMPKKSQPNNQGQAQPKAKESNDDAKRYKRAYTYMPRDNSPYANQQNSKPKYRYSYNQKKSSNSFIGIILFVCMILIYFAPPLVGFKDPLFVLTPSERYNVKIKTKTLKVTYFVKSDYEPSAEITDQTIESLYLQRIQRQCDKSLKSKRLYEKLIKRATSEAQVTNFMESISNIDLKPCKKIIRLIKQHPNIKLTIFTNNIVGL